MAIADYLQKNAIAASQILEGFNYEGFLRSLNRHCIGLLVDGSAATEPEGLATADLAIRLLARLYPRLAIVAADGAATATTAGLRALAAEINPSIDITESLDSVSYCLAVGRTRITLKKPPSFVVYVGSANWTAKVSLSEPIGSGPSQNPFGAGVAACLGAATIFKLVFADQLSTQCPIEDVTLSVLDLKAGEANIPGFQAPAVGRVFLSGAGAIGNGVIWAFSRGAASGELIIIDPQKVELSNVQRYVMTVRDDVEKAKVSLAQNWLQNVPHLRVQACPQTWDQYAQQSDWKFERVLVALDTAEDRIGVQASLPRWIANGWTLGSGAGISRHYFRGRGACLACLYLPAGVTPSEDTLVASALGFDTSPQNPELIQIRQRLDRDIPTEQAFLKLIADKKKVPLQHLVPFEGRPLRELYTDGICGGGIFSFNVNGREARAEVPMAFQSAMAGILLAAELAADALALRGMNYPTITHVDLLRGLPPALSTPRGKDADGRCLCQDADYVAAFGEKYGDALA